MSLNALTTSTMMRMVGSMTMTLGVRVRPTAPSVNLRVYLSVTTVKMMMVVLPLQQQQPVMGEGCRKDVAAGSIVGMFVDFPATVSAYANCILDQ